MNSQKTNEIFDLVERCFQKDIRKVKNMTPAEWVEEYVVLSRLSSNISGNYEFSNSPAWEWITNQMANPEVRRISVEKSVQVGGTQWIINCMLYSVDMIGLPILYVGQTQGDVKKFLKAKYDPVESECVPVMELKPKTGESWKEKTYDTCLMDIGWGGSANSVASSSKGVVLLDEINKYVQKDKTDVHPAQGARERVTGFPDNHKLLETSTPTDDKGEISKAYLEGSQHSLQIACPECDFRQEMTFSMNSLVWSDDSKNEEGEWNLDKVEETAKYVCCECGYQMDEEDRIMALDDLLPVQGNLNAPKDHISVRVHAFHSKFMSLGKIAVRFLKGRKTPNGLRAFYTQVLGMPFVPEAVTNTAKTIRDLRDRTPYVYLRPDKTAKIYELPCEVAYISTTIDVQGSSFWIMQCAFTKEGHCMILDWGEVYSYKEITRWIRRKFSFKGRKYTSRFNFIDSGYLAKKLGGVYLYVIKMGGLVLPCVGRDNPHFEVVQERVQTFRGISFNLYSFQDPYFKEILYQHRMRSFSNEQLWFPKVTDNDLINQLTDERLIEKETANGVKMVWEAKEDNNHLGDCLKMQMVLWEELGAKSLQSAS